MQLQLRSTFAHCTDIGPVFVGGYNSKPLHTKFIANVMGRINTLYLCMRTRSTWSENCLLVGFGLVLGLGLGLPPSVLYKTGISGVI